MPKLTEAQKSARESFVYAACDALLQRGTPPASAADVRAEMLRMRPQEAAGDTRYIQQFLMDWRDHQAGKSDADSTAIPNAVLDVLRMAFHAQVVKAKFECDGRLDGMLVDAQEMLGLNSKLEEQVEQLEADLVRRTSERDEALGALAECRSQLECSQASSEEARVRQEGAAAQLAAAIAEGADLQRRCLASQQAARASSEVAEQLRRELDAAQTTAKAALERADAAEAAAEGLRATIATRSFLKPGRHVASIPQRFKHGMSAPSR